MILIYTVCCVAFFSILTYNYFREQNVQYLISVLNMRAYHWKDFVKHRIELNATPRFVQADGSLEQNAEGFRKLFSGEIVGLYTAKGGLVHKIKGSAPGSLSRKLQDREFVLTRNRFSSVLSLSHNDKKYLLYVTIPFAKDAFMPQGIYGFLVSFILIFALLAFFLGVLVSLIVIRPVKTITQYTRRVAEGEFDAHRVMETGDEIEELSRSFSDMTARVRDMQETARDSSPLTGLPGNNTITSVIEKSIRECLHSVVVYIDVDNFKAYNDVYGFSAGDRALLYLAKILKSCVQSFESRDKDIFLGHVGGDDFIVVADANHVRKLAETVCHLFDKDIHTLYNAADLEKDGIEVEDREGNKRKFPLMSISMAGVSVWNRGFNHFSEVTTVAAQVKKVAKWKQVSNFVMDRRKGISQQFSRPDTEKNKLFS